MQCSAVVQCSAVQCSTVQCSAVQCTVVQCSVVAYFHPLLEHMWREVGRLAGQVTLAGLVPGAGLVGVLLVLVVLWCFSCSFVGSGGGDDGRGGTWGRSIVHFRITLA